MAAWVNGGRGGVKSRDGRWSIVRLGQSVLRFLVCEASDRYVKHPEFTTRQAAKEYVEHIELRERMPH